MMILTSKNNPLIKETASLKEKKGRKELGLFLVEGAKMVSECAKSGFEIERVFVSENYQGSSPCEENKTVVVSEDVLRFLSDEKSPQGILCRVKIPAKALCAPKGKSLFLDGVADPGNVGAIIRTANAAGYDDVYFTRVCADPYSPKSVRASMSGLFFTRLHFGEREEILSLLRESDTPILAADMDGENVFTFKAPKRFALVIGNEANGVSEEVFAQASHTIKIPMKETQESLNAAVSAGIIMYVLAKDEF
ncbi:MAG: RNA methyltransferase [Clostridiales bacterium]|nr:RNA methyltransferase [Clostridiales bacterium]